LKKENPEEAERLLEGIRKESAAAIGISAAAESHAWLDSSKSRTRWKTAVKEFESALKLDPKNKIAHEALKRLKKG